MHCLLWQRLPEAECATTIPLDAYIVDTLMPDLVGHDRQPSAFLVYLYLWRQTHGSGAPTTQVALLDIADANGAVEALGAGRAWAG